ncbi:MULTISPECIES: hypothetical protein [Thioclava]|uniref:REDY-like protein HapK n=1 Tax=Thioclava litoralis TaxID=3076557 RepID=A0ABZ1E2T5_9RHOB|nr:hypothetical protein RPE78_13970 [Thioclava sp. FTW29]
MHLIIHKIRLLAPEQAAAFEAWVLGTDYATCPQLPSVEAFSVQRADAGQGFDYFEVITVTSQAAFEADMASAAFASLVAAFSGMAEVVEELSGAQLGQGYRRAACL